VNLAQVMILIKPEEIVLKISQNSDLCDDRE
jgi:hypothetical protein